MSGFLVKEKTQPKIVERAAANLPQTTQSALFTITGQVAITYIRGEVTTIIQTQANATKLVANPTSGSDDDLCATLDITGDVVGTQYYLTSTQTDAMKEAAQGASFPALVDQPIILNAGTLDLSCAASNTGQIKWTIHYIPLSPDGLVVAA